VNSCEEMKERIISRALRDVRRFSFLSIAEGRRDFYQAIQRRPNRRHLRLFEPAWPNGKKTVPDTNLQSRSNNECKDN
jgi:hypothetical protein